MQVAIAGSGLIAPGDDATPAAARRARRAGSLLVRDARFSRGVIAAYGGLCAMCGLAVGLVEGAHIYPVSAPGSCDEPWNGLALCANHHLAFDKHLVGVDIVTSKVVIHEDVRQQAPKSAAVRAFVDGTYPRLAPPSERSARPRAEMFELRYAFYLDRYNWLLDS
jgi:predicted restriction endonuclease